jgi:hypothetical protein
MNIFKVGDYARNVENGWLGQIVDLDPQVLAVGTGPARLQTIACMVGVDPVLHLVCGMDRDNALCVDDIQWHATADLQPA